MCPGVRLEGQLGWFAHPLAGAMCNGHAQPPAFAPLSSKVAVGFSGLFVSSVQNLPQLHLRAVIFSPMPFPRILLLSKRCAQVQASQLYGTGPQGPGVSHHQPAQLGLWQSRAHTGVPRVSQGTGCPGRGAGWGAGAEDGSVCGPGFPSFSVSSESPPSTYCSGCQCHQESLTRTATTS